MKQPNKRQIATLLEFMDQRCGCRAVSDWTNGSGRHVTKRAVPVFCKELPISEAVALPGLSGEYARRLRKARPRVQRVVVVVDRRAANRATRDLWFARAQARMDALSLR